MGLLATIPDSSPIVPQGRLTTESGVAISTSDRTAQSTIYFTPYLGNRLTLYTGSTWNKYTFSELSLALSSLTSGRNYDVFVYNNAGTLTLELSAAWNVDNVTRTDALATQDGFKVKSGATTRLLLGTIRTTGTTTTEDSGGGSTTNVGGKRFVWNYYNRLKKPLAVIDTTDSWTYATNTIRQARGNAGNEVEFVCGDTILLESSLTANFSGASNGVVAAKAGIALDSITAFSGIVAIAFTASVNTITAMTSNYAALVTAGYHYLAWLEKGAAGTSVFFGDDGGDGSQSGLTAIIEA